MKKILFIATVESHILRFHLPYLKMFKEHGYEVHTACLGESPIPYCDLRHQIPFQRSPFKISNLTSYKMLRKIIKSHQYDIIHCHTPVGGVLGRLASIGAAENASIFYTAHGFQFCKSGPLRDWLIYYPVEKIMSYATDYLITINNEDFDLAKKKFHAKNTRLINGVGVPPEKFDAAFSDEKIAALRVSEGLEPEDFVLLYVADLSKRKNQGFIIKSAPNLKKSIPNLKIIFAGPDTAGGIYQKLASMLHAESYVKFTGERNDIPELLVMADISVSSSQREGLAVNIIEAQAAGQCVVASDVRGNRDLITDGADGFLYPSGDRLAFEGLITDLYNNPAQIKKTGESAKCSSEKYSLKVILGQMEELYSTASIGSDSVGSGSAPGV